MYHCNKLTILHAKSPISETFYIDLLKITLLLNYGMTFRLRHVLENNKITTCG